MSLLEFLSDATQKNNIPLVLIGGFAVNFYNISRQTTDIDFLIQDKDIQPLIAALQTIGYSVTQQEAAFARLSAPVSQALDVDFMLVDPDTFQKILSDGKQVSLQNRQFVVPSLPHLVTLKLHALKNNWDLRKWKDLPDIINLLRANNVSANASWLKETCLKYGSEDIYGQITDGMKTA
jgi:hypothetical protein